MTFNDDKWKAMDERLKAQTSSLAEPPNPYASGAASKPQTSSTTAAQQIGRLPTQTKAPVPADSTASYKNIQSAQTTFINDKSTYAYDNLKAINNDNYATPETLPQNSQQYNNLNTLAYSKSPEFNPFQNFNTAQATKSIQCLAQNFLPSLPSIPGGLPLPSLDSLFNFNIFDYALKASSILPKVGSFTGFNAIDFLVNTARSYVDKLLGPISNTLKTISNCLKQD